MGTPHSGYLGTAQCARVPLCPLGRRGSNAGHTLPPPHGALAQKGSNPARCPVCRHPCHRRGLAQWALPWMGLSITGRAEFRCPPQGSPRHCAPRAHNVSRGHCDGSSKELVRHWTGSGGVAMLGNWGHVQEMKADPHCPSVAISSEAA